MSHVRESPAPRAARHILYGIVDVVTPSPHAYLAHMILHRTDDRVGHTAAHTTCTLGVSGSQLNAFDIRSAMC